MPQSFRLFPHGTVDPGPIIVPCGNIIYASHADTNIDNINTSFGTTDQLSGSSVIVADSKFGAGSVYTVNLNGNGLKVSHANLGSVTTLQMFFKIDESTDNSHNGICNIIDNTVVLYVDYFNAGHFLTLYSNSTKVDSAKEIVMGVWYHLAVTCNEGRDTKVYIDGQLVVTGLPFSNTSSLTMKFGTADAFGAFGIGGVVDDILVTDTLDITGNFTPPTAPFLTDCP